MEIRRKVKNPIPVLLKLLLRNGMLLIVTGTFLAVWYTRVLPARFFQPITDATINFVFLLLKLLGLQAGTSGAVIFDKCGFAYAISYRCTGLFVITLWLSIVACTRQAGWQRRIVWFIIGALILYGLNLIRLVSLYLLGVYAPAFFEVAESVIWELILISMLGFLYLCISVRKYDDRRCSDLKSPSLLISNPCNEHS